MAGAAAAVATVAALAAAALLFDAASAASKHGATDSGGRRVAWDWLQTSSRMRRDVLGELDIAERPWVMMPLPAAGGAWRRQSVPTFTPRLGRDSSGDDLVEEEAGVDGGSVDGGQPLLAPPFWPRPGRRAPTPPRLARHT